MSDQEQDQERLLEAVRRLLEGGKDGRDDQALEAAHPSDVGAMLQRLPLEQQVALFRRLTAERAGEVLPALDDTTLLTLVRAPQAFRLALAPMTNDFVAMLKDSSLVSVLTVLELTKQTQIFATNLGSWVIPGTLCAGLYLAMSLPLAAAARSLERRWKAPQM